MSEWIKCSDRMPEEMVYVLIYGPIERVQDACIMSMNDSLFWFNGDYYLRKSEVTHWMPLPQPPEEQKCLY